MNRAPGRSRGMAPTVRWATGCFVFVALLVSARGSAITREEVILRAHAFAYHPWRCSSANLTAACSSAYRSAYTVGDYMGLPYDWGGYMSLFEFDQGIASGLGAGSYPSDGVLECTVGLDCSGFVSQTWATSHHTTTSIPSISVQISQQDLLPGDVFNKSGYHVVLFERKLANGDPVFYESAGYNVHVNVTGGWSYVSSYTPLRYVGITGTSVGIPSGTIDNPIAIGSFPFTDSRDTSKSPSDLLDGCAASPSKKETGPEVVYTFTLIEPGRVRAVVADDANTDVDIHLYTSMNTNDCVARDDTTIDVNLDCGTYFLVADTYRTAAGDEYPGPYTLTVTFTPSGGLCGGGPPSYIFSGSLGSECAYPGHEDLPFCNPNLGATTCIYSTEGTPISFCSKPCATSADCGTFEGGCCGLVGSGQRYCLLAQLCSDLPDAGEKDAGVLDGAPDGQVPPRDGPSQPDGPRPDGALPDGGAAADGPSADAATAGHGGGCALGDGARHTDPNRLLFLFSLPLALFVRRRRRVKASPPGPNGPRLFRDTGTEPPPRA